MNGATTPQSLVATLNCGAQRGEDAVDTELEGPTPEAQRPRLPGHFVQAVVPSSYHLSPPDVSGAGLWMCLGPVSIQHSVVQGHVFLPFPLILGEGLARGR